MSWPKALALALLVLLWGAAYLVWPRVSFDDGPFGAGLYSGDVGALAVHSAVDLAVAGLTVFRLETRTTPEPTPRTVFVLSTPGGRRLWQRAADPAFGRIALSQSHTGWAWWGGFRVGIKPEHQESGHLYLGPLGGFRYFFHSW